MDENKDPYSTSTDEEFKFLYRDVVDELIYFNSGLNDNLSKEGVLLYCKNKLVSIIDSHFIRSLEENGLDHLVKAVEQINKIKN